MSVVRLPAFIILFFPAGSNRGKWGFYAKFCIKKVENRAFPLYFPLRQQEGMKTMKRINGRDVAQAASCSQATVSRVIRSDPRISLETRKRVLDAARRLGYDMRSASGSWGVGVIVCLDPNDINGYYAKILASVCREIFRRGLHPELIWQQSLQEGCTRSFRGILDLYQTPDRELGALFQVPVVRINGKADHLNHIWSVNSDSAAGIAAAVRHLLRNGHRDIRFVSLEGIYNEKNKVTRRWEGFLRAMQSAGIPDPEKRAIFFHNQMQTDQKELESSIRRAIREGCTALICVNSVHTLKVNAALHSLHLRVPEDLSLIDWEYDGVSEYLDPPRTTVITDYAKLASEALDLLTEILTADHLPPNRIVQAKLLIRKSTARRTASDASTSRSPM